MRCARPLVRRCGCIGGCRRRGRRCRRGRAWDGGRRAARCGRCARGGRRGIGASSAASGRCRSRAARRVRSSRSASSRRTSSSRSSSGRSASSGAGTADEDADEDAVGRRRPGNFWLAKLAAMMRRFSICGTTKPKLSSGWLICERRQARLTTAQEAYSISARAAARSGAAELRSWAAAWVGVARMRASNRGARSRRAGEWREGCRDASGRRCVRDMLVICVLRWTALGGRRLARAVIRLAMPSLGAANRP